jgi:hypothetical protein
VKQKVTLNGIGADSMAMSFQNVFSLPVTIARFDTYGYRQSARAVTPTLIM